MPIAFFEGGELARFLYDSLKSLIINMKTTQAIGVDMPAFSSRRGGDRTRRDFRCWHKCEVPTASELGGEAENICSHRVFRILALLRYTNFAMRGPFSGMPRKAFAQTESF
jgi:hypothetical protein